MNRAQLIDYLAKIDENLDSEAVVVIYGSAAFMLLEEEMRTSLDIDVAAPYSMVSQSAFCKAAEMAGLPVNPDGDYADDHIEWIGPLRLCLPKPDDATDIVLWQGKFLVVKTVSAAGLIASKLIRYDETDQSDIHFLYFQMRISIDDIEAAVDTLPPAFRNDVMVRDNLENLKSDVMIWEVDR